MDTSLSKRSLNRKYLESIGISSDKEEYLEDIGITSEKQNYLQEIGISVNQEHYFEEIGISESVISEQDYLKQIGVIESLEVQEGEITDQDISDMLELLESKEETEPPKGLLARLFSNKRKMLTPVVVGCCLATLITGVVNGSVDITTLTTPLQHSITTTLAAKTAQGAVKLLKNTEWGNHILKKKIPFSETLKQYKLCKQIFGVDFDFTVEKLTSFYVKEAVHFTMNGGNVASYAFSFATRTAVNSALYAVSSDTMIKTVKGAKTTITTAVKSTLKGENPLEKPIEDPAHQIIEDEKVVKEQETKVKAVIKMSASLASMLYNPSLLENGAIRSVLFDTLADGIGFKGLLQKMIPDKAPELEFLQGKIKMLQGKERDTYIKKFFDIWYSGKIYSRRELQAMSRSELLEELEAKNLKLSDRLTKEQYIKIFLDRQQKNYEITYQYILDMFMQRTKDVLITSVVNKLTNTIYQNRESIVNMVKDMAEEKMNAFMEFVDNPDLYNLEGIVPERLQQARQVLAEAIDNIMLENKRDESTTPKRESMTPKRESTTPKREMTTPKREMTTPKREMTTPKKSAIERANERLEKRRLEESSGDVIELEHDPKVFRYEKGTDLEVSEGKTLNPQYKEQRQFAREEAVKRALLRAERRRLPSESTETIQLQHNPSVFRYEKSTDLEVEPGKTLNPLYKEQKADYDEKVRIQQERHNAYLRGLERASHRSKLATGEVVIQAFDAKIDETIIEEQFKEALDIEVDNVAVEIANSILRHSQVGNILGALNGDMEAAAKLAINTAFKSQIDTVRTASSAIDIADATAQVSATLYNVYNMLERRDADPSTWGGWLRTQLPIADPNILKGLRGINENVKETLSSIETESFKFQEGKISVKEVVIDTLKEQIAHGWSNFDTVKNVAIKLSGISQLSEQTGQTFEQIMENPAFEKLTSTYKSMMSLFG